MEGRPNLEDDRWLRWAVALFPVLFIAIALTAKILTPSLYSYMIREDRPVEWLTGLAFLGAGGFAFLLALRLHRDRHMMLAVLYAGLGAGMLFAMLEEISWGQRILNMEASEFFKEQSTKEEINVHNLKSFPLHFAFIVVGLYGAFSRLLVPGSIKRRYPFEVDLLTPRYAIAPFFLVTFAIYTYFEYVYFTVLVPLGITIRRDYTWEQHFITGKEQEPVELLLATGFLIFIVNNWQRHKALKAAAVSVSHAPEDRDAALRSTKQEGSPTLRP